MSSSIIPWQRNLPSQRKVSRGLVLQVDGIQAIAEIARCATDEISAVHTYTAQRVAATLAAADLIKQLGGADGPEYDEFVSYLDQTYLKTVAHIAGSASHRIALSVDEVPSHVDNRGAFEKATDGARRVVDDTLAKLL